MLILETIAEAATARLVAAGLCAGNVELHRDPPTGEEVLPLAQVTYASDGGVADGNPRTGTSDFVHTLTLAVDVLDHGATGAAVMAKLAQHGETIMQALVAEPWAWSDAIEGIAGVRQEIEKSPKGQSIVYRLQVQIDLLYRSQWAPATDELDDFEGVTVDAGGGIGADVPVPTE